jgi:hypothetical protein
VHGIVVVASAFELEGDLDVALDAELATATRNSTSVTSA